MKPDSIIWTAGAQGAQGTDSCEAFRRAVELAQQDGFYCGTVPAIVNALRRTKRLFPLKEVLEPKDVAELLKEGYALFPISNSFELREVYAYVSAGLAPAFTSARNYTRCKKMLSEYIAVEKEEQHGKS